MKDPGDSYPQVSVAARVAKLTTIAVSSSMLITAIAMWFMFGSSQNRPMTTGEIWTVAMVLSALSPALICPLMTIPMSRLVRDLRAAQGALAAAAMRDPLTGLLNRRGFDLAATQALDAGAGSAAALMCDLDHFKSINDRFGHEFGDEALRRIAARLRQALAPRPALLARQGGEEFVVLLPDARLDEAAALAEGVRAACAAEMIEFADLTANVTVSIGVAAGAERGAGMRALIGRADAALYQAKREGRNRVVLAAGEAPAGLAA